MDRLLATQLGCAAANLITTDTRGVMISIRSGETIPVPLAEVVDKRRVVPLDHIWVKTARRVGTSFGD